MFFLRALYTMHELFCTHYFARITSRASVRISCPLYFERIIFHALFSTHYSASIISRAQPAHLCTHFTRIVSHPYFVCVIFRTHYFSRIILCALHRATIPLNYFVDCAHLWCAELFHAYDQYFQTGI